MKEELVVVEMADDFAITSFRNVFVTSWRKGVTVAALRRVDAASDRFAARWPEGYVAASISFYKSPMPDDAARRLASEMMKRSEGRVQASCSILEGEGFWAGTARSVVAAMNFAAGTKYPFKVAATPEEAATWLAPYAGHVDGGAALAAALHGLRARHAAYGGVPA